MTDKKDLELHFIRTLSTGGLKLSGDMSREDQRERIRIAILDQQLERKKLGSETYQEAFERCYGRPLERRREKPIIVDEDDEEEPL